MNRIITTDAKIEEIETFGSSVVFNCLTPRRRQFSTTITYNDTAPRNSSRFQKWCLLQAMAKSYEIEIEAQGFIIPKRLVGCFFKFRLVEWHGNWLIEKFRRCDPFEVSDGIKNLEDYLREAGHEVS